MNAQDIYDCRVKVAKFKTDKRTNVTTHLNIIQQDVAINYHHLVMNKLVPLCGLSPLDNEYLRRYIETTTVERMVRIIVEQHKNFFLTESTNIVYTYRWKFLAWCETEQKWITLQDKTGLPYYCFRDGDLNVPQ